MAKIKICVVGPSKKFLSGISYYTIRLSNSLSEAYGVSALCFRNLLPQFMFPGSKHVGKDISSIDFNAGVTVFNGMDYNNPISWYRAYKFLNEEKPDVIILQWWTSSVAHLHLFVSLMNSLSVKAKVIIEFHEVVDPLEESILPLRIYSRIMGRLLVTKACLYITHSESDKSLVVAKYRIPQDQVQVIPHGLYDQYTNGPDKEHARQRLGIGDEFVVLTFGLIRPYKGIPYLIKAFGELPETIANKSRLVIAGEIWEDREAVTQAISSSAYADRIMLVDSYIPDDAISLYFGSADVVVLPYLRASQSGVAHIAMSFGKPIIVSKVGGLEESMAEYGGTYFIPPADSTAIKEAIMKIYDDRPPMFEPPKRSWDVIKQKYDDVIGKIMERGSS